VFDGASKNGSSPTAPTNSSTTCEAHLHAPEGVASFGRCDESVNAALRTLARELTIEVRGLRHGNVEVRRDNVTLRGGDPSQDGFRGVGSGDKAGDDVLRVRDARNVRFENSGPGSCARGMALVGESRHGDLNCSDRDAERGCGYDSVVQPAQIERLAC
jgi:hypothetical protein